MYNVCNVRMYVRTYVRVYVYVCMYVCISFLGEGEVGFYEVAMRSKSKVVRAPCVP